MQKASTAYKAEMKKTLRGHAAAKVSIGVINQEARADARIEPAGCAYFSEYNKPLDGYTVNPKELYACCDQDYTIADGRMYFLPRDTEDVVLNNGVVTERVTGTITLNFSKPFDIKGLTLEFGKTYPVDFQIETGRKILPVEGNASGHFVTDAVFPESTFIKIIPRRMVNGQGRLHLHRITLGIGIDFNEEQIVRLSKKEVISPVSENLQALDLAVTVKNTDRRFSIEDATSVFNFFEAGQRVELSFLQELDDGSWERIPTACLELKEWSADNNQMCFSATDRFDRLAGTFYGGRYSPDGTTLYDLAVDVFTAAGVDPRTYVIDPYLKGVRVQNPVPPLPYNQALQLIANAGRCLLYQDRSGNIVIKSNFVPDVAAIVPDMTAEGDGERYYSSVSSVLNDTVKANYTAVARDYNRANGAMVFAPRENSESLMLDAGYISQAVSDAQGIFSKNPVITLALEASFKTFGVTLEFGGNYPRQLNIHSILAGVEQEVIAVDVTAQIFELSHEFPEFDELQLEFIQTVPHNPIVLRRIRFGSVTDYTLKPGTDMNNHPVGTQLKKVKEVEFAGMNFLPSLDEAKELCKEKVLCTDGQADRVFTFSDPVYDLQVMADTGRAVITDSTTYMARVHAEAVPGDSVELRIVGKTYRTAESRVIKQLRPSGSTEKWSNPLVSSQQHQADMIDWLGRYMLLDRIYDISYRGDPRIDGGDVVILGIDTDSTDMLVRVESHELTYDGAYKGKIKARRDASNVDRT